MIEKDHPQLSIRAQADLLAVNRNRLESTKSKSSPSAQELDWMRRLDELHLKYPFMGYRRLQLQLKDGQEQAPSQWQVRRLMRIMGIYGIAPGPKTSRSQPEHKKYPYLLRHYKVTRVDQVWCADITYIPLARGCAYLVAVMDWHSRAVLSWAISSTLDSDFCVEALKEAIRTTGRTPEIFNTDQGVQFTSQAWVEALQEHEIRISMDGKGRWMDNVFIERLWRSYKYEDLYLKSYQNIIELKRGAQAWMKFYNRVRPHQSLENQTPWAVYGGQNVLKEAA